MSNPAAGAIRILLVISRPAGADDVPFRSVAARLIKGVASAGVSGFDLHVLRPPTFDRLEQVLRAAYVAGTPFHVVHFDGHGGFAAGRGQITFEHPMYARNEEAVRGNVLGGLLYNTGVPLLVLNACRSAYAESPASPPDATANSDGRRAPAFGSFAQEVIDAGVSGVVAMRYNVYVVTAAQFVAELYAALRSGLGLPDAVRAGRDNLHRDPERVVASAGRHLDDWIVPVVYLAGTVAYTTRASGAPNRERHNFSSDATTPPLDDVGLGARKVPSPGFFGRDETVHHIDRSFERSRLVLLYGFAGSGNTSVAAEFGRWYRITGGVAGPVLFTSFEAHKSLGQILNEDFAPAFAARLAQGGVAWLALSPNERRALSLEILSLTPVLWIWDNVETITDPGTGVPSLWTSVEQRELAEFLAAASQTLGKVLLTSRRGETSWLSSCEVVRIGCGRMPLRECHQLLVAIAARLGHRVIRIEQWISLLRFSNGNPLVLSMLINQAFKHGPPTTADVDRLVASIRKGESELTTFECEGYDKTLFASLSYGVAKAFSRHERRQVALLHLFEAFLDARVWAGIGASRAPWKLAEMEWITQNEASSILGRAVNLGMLLPRGNLQFTVHPAVPLFINTEFRTLYSAPRIIRAQRAFVGVVAERAHMLSEQLEMGNRSILELVALEEGNFLRARDLALASGLITEVLTIMHSLMRLYVGTGRHSEWVPLVHEVSGRVIDSATGAALPGQEGNWITMMQYLVMLARERRDWTEADRLHSMWETSLRTTVAAIPVSTTLTDEERNQILWLAVALHERGVALLAQERPECIAAFEEDFSLSLRINDAQGAAVTAGNLSEAYMSVDNARDLAEAARWSDLSMQYRDNRDTTAKARHSLHSAKIAFLQHQECAPDDPHRSGFLRQAQNRALASLELLPDDAINEQNVCHHLLGLVFGEAGNTVPALFHFGESLRLEEIQKNVYGAAQTRASMATLLGAANEPEKALRYAEAALTDFTSIGVVGDELAGLEVLIASIRSNGS